MTSNYYIKLYHEILDDPKMMLLPEEMFSLAIKLFLLAGVHERDGYLPWEDEIAWRLRMDKDVLEEGLIYLKGVILEKKEERWYITKFKERQDPIEPTERWRKWKERQRKKDYYLTNNNGNANEVQTKRLTDKIILDKNISEEGGVGLPAGAYDAYNNNDTEKATQLYTTVTGQMSIPAAKADLALAYLYDILDHYRDNEDLMVKDGKRAFAGWCGTKGKTGRKYSPLNVNWLEHWLRDLVPIPAEPKAVMIEPEYTPEEQAIIREELRETARKLSMK